MANIRYTDPADGGNLTVVGSDDADTILPAVITIVDGNGLDTATTPAGRDTIFALGGNDAVFGGNSDDTLFGDSGNDTLRGGAGNDRLFGGIGNDVLKGNAGNDTIAVEVNYPDLTPAGFGTDVISGGDGDDTVTFQSAFIVRHFLSNPTAVIEEADHGVAVDLGSNVFPGFVSDFLGNVGQTGLFAPSTGQIRGQITDANGTSAVLADVENFTLTSHGDLFIDSTASHRISGQGGDDFLMGGAGFDVLDGGSGIDTALYNLSQSAVSVSLLDVGNGGSGSGGEAEGDRLISIENVIASNRNDFVLGDGKANMLSGLDGNDTLIGGNGNDTLIGGKGDDTLRTGLGADTVDGGDGIDTVQLRDWNGISAPLFGSVSGRITLGSGDAAGSATLSRSAFSTASLGVVTTTVETDALTRIENVTGSNHNETITGNDAANILDGSGGNDTLDGGKGNDTLIGGDGSDTAAFAAQAIFEEVTVDASLETGVAKVSRTVLVPEVETDTLRGIENLKAGSGDDHLVGNAADNTLDGGAGDDLLAGRAGNNRLVGGDGIDTADYAAHGSFVAVDLGAGRALHDNGQTDLLSGIENLTGSEFGDSLVGSAAGNVILGNGGDDVIEGGAGEDTLDGGAGVNTLSYEGSAGRVAMALDNSLIRFGDSVNDTLFNFQNLTGSNIGSDTLRGDAGNNVISGLGGNDLLSGGLGADTLIGGDGNDGADYRADGAIAIDLQAGTAAGAAAGDTFAGIEAFFGGAGINDMKGDDAANTFVGNEDNDALQGRGGNDVLSGLGGRDNLQGGDGDDQISGGLENDRLFGNAGSDRISGDEGLDTINGGNGDDTLTGGIGADTFVFAGRLSGRDTVLDFEDRIDHIQIDSAVVTSFADLSIAGNGTDHVTVLFGGQSADLFSADHSAITLSAVDFIIV